MRVVLLCAVLALGCSKKSETKNEPAKQEPAKPADKPAEGATPAPAKPAEPPPPPAPPAAKVDCDALLTAADVEAACKVKVEIKATMYEGKGDLMVCNRTVKDPAKHATANFGVSRFPSTAAIDSWIDLDKKNSKEAKFTDVAGIGDGAYTREAEMKSLKSKDFDLGVRKGTMMLHLGYTVNEINAKPPCTPEQLQDLAKIVVARLP